MILGDANPVSNYECRDLPFVLPQPEASLPGFARETLDAFGVNLGTAVFLDRDVHRFERLYTTQSLNRIPNRIFSGNGATTLALPTFLERRTALANASPRGHLAATPLYARMIEERYGDVVRDPFGIELFSW